MSSAAGSYGASDYLLSSDPRRSHTREQAAAVCYRVGNQGVEFLLVRTRGGRWTFPKGGIEPGSSHAQSAAMEAFEEAGVHGRMELVAFARYVQRKPSKSPQKSALVLAFLCEVHRLSKPQESKRNRTWFSAEKAKLRLRNGRDTVFGAELAAVVDRAVARVQRLHSAYVGKQAGTHTVNEALRRVCFEASESAAFGALAFTRRYSGRKLRSPESSSSGLPSSRLPSSMIGVAAEQPVQRFLLAEPQKLDRPVLRLGNGSKSVATARVASIDRRENSPAGSEPKE